jgi:glycosyltransferase involved in cell wall biosynthesis
MRARGFHIQTASIDFPNWAAGECGSAEVQETSSTFYVKRRGLTWMLADHAVCFLRRPLRYLAGLGFAFRLAGLDLRDVVLHVAYFAEAVVVGRWMERNALAHLHVHFANASATVALLAGRVFGIPYSITIHGTDEFYGLALYRLPQKIESASFACCIGRYCRSQAMKASAPDQWEKLEICPLGIDPEVFTPRQAATGGPFEILCVGRLVPAKGQSILLAAAAKLIERGRNLHVSLVGDGPARALFEAVAARLKLTGHVKFHGSVTQDRIRNYLERADAFVLPSFAEGVPVTLMEAMAMEIPSVSTFIGGIPELIQSGENGILVPPSDPDLLADAIEKLIADPELCARLGRAGRRTVVSRYNLRSNVERKASIFDRRLK